MSRVMTKPTLWPASEQSDPFAISFSTCNRIGTRTKWTLIRLRGCAGWSGSMLVANALFWFCRDTVHILKVVVYV
jgi:hypothetical protein